MSFGYHAPADLEEALALLRALGPDAVIIAGGTDLLVKMKRGRAAPRWVVDLGRIVLLTGVADHEDGLSIGAMTKISTVERESPSGRLPALLSEAAHNLGSPQIRNLATIGGNICNAAPSAEMGAPLLALDAIVVVRSADGSRRVPLTQFFAGPGATILMHDEVVVAIQIPTQSAGAKACYLRTARKAAADIATAAVAVSLELDPAHGIVRSARIALGAVAPTPVRAAVAEEMLVGEKLDADLAGRVAAEASESGCRPISDIRASAEYRREIVRVLTQRALLRVGREAGVLF